MNDRPIGIFDSGIGGLTVTKEIVKLLPKESIIYLGDTARVPYGTRSKEIVTQFAKELVNFLLKKSVKALVVACNTISAQALDEIKRTSPIPVVDVLGPAVRKAVKSTGNKKVGVIGTVGTIGSGAYENKIKESDSQIEVISVGCPLFVPLAEEGLHQHEATKSIAEDYLNEIVSKEVDTLILGCTHYPLLLEAIVDAVGPGVRLVDSARPTAEELEKVLKENNLLSKNQNPNLEFFVTDAPERVHKVAARFFGSQLKIRKVTL